MKWEMLKWQDFPAAVEASKGVCVIPLGAMEKHGMHLCVGTDNLVVEEVVNRAAEIEPVVVFPTFRYGHINGLQNFDGSICLSNKLMLDYMTELCREIARSGFKKILLFNGHGGNFFLFKTFCNSTAEEKKDYVVAFSTFIGPEMKDVQKAVRERPADFAYLTDEDRATIDSFCAQPMDHGHACFMETAWMLDVCPEGVDLSMMDKEDWRCTHRMDHLQEKDIYSPWIWMGNQPNSHEASYHPGCNERIGKAAVQLLVEKTVDIFKTMKEDNDLLGFNAEWNAQW